MAALAAALVMLAALAACGRAAPAKPASTHRATASASVHPAALPAAPHRGVRLNVLVVSDGSPPVEAIRQQLALEGVPVTVVSLHDPSRQAITGAFRPAPGTSGTSTVSCCPAPLLPACPGPRRPRWPGMSVSSACARWTPILPRA